MEREIPDTGEDEVVAGIEIREPVVTLWIEAVLQGIPALGTKRVQVQRLGPGVGRIDLNSMCERLAYGVKQRVVVGKRIRIDVGDVAQTRTWANGAGRRQCRVGSYRLTIRINELVE